MNLPIISMVIVQFAMLVYQRVSKVIYWFEYRISIGKKDNYGTFYGISLWLIYLNENQDSNRSAIITKNEGEVW